MFEMRLVFSYCEGAYCTQIDNKSCEEPSPRPSGSSVSKILLHEHLLNYGVLNVILGFSDEPNDVLGGGLLFDQKWICWFRLGFRGRGLDCLPIRFVFCGVSPCLGWLVRAIAAQVSLSLASEATPLLS